mgnify:CR=1 FL=1
MCALPVWLGVFRRVELRERHADLFVPFFFMTGIFGPVVVLFPIYAAIIPTDGYSNVNLVIWAAVLVPWTVFGLRYAGRDHFLTTRGITGFTALVYLFIGILILSLVGNLPDSSVIYGFLGFGIVGLHEVTFAVAGAILLSTYPARQSPPRPRSRARGPGCNVIDGNPITRHWP